MTTGEGRVACCNACTCKPGLLRAGLPHDHVALFRWGRVRISSWAVVGSSLLHSPSLPAHPPLYSFNVYLETEAWVSNLKQKMVRWLGLSTRTGWPAGIAR